MRQTFHQVPLQPIPPWGYSGNSILGAHCGTVTYLYAPKAAAIPLAGPARYFRNEDIWKDILESRVNAGHEIVLDGFQIIDWFPRAPGLYHTSNAEHARDEAFRHLLPKLMPSPIRDHAGRSDNVKPGSDYTVVFTPAGKLSMLQGGIGCIRLKPIKISGEPHWLITATSDGIAHAGVPIAVPQAKYGQLVPRFVDDGAVSAEVVGTLEFLDDPFSQLFDSYERVPRLYVKVKELHLRAQTLESFEVSAAVSFVSKYEGRPEVYATYVTFEPNIKGSFDDAVSWMKRKYVEGEYDGRIITDFDQTKTIFKEAKLALRRVMAGQSGE